MGGRTCCGCGCGRCNGCANSRSRSVDSRNRCPDSRTRYENARSRYYDRDRDLESRAQPPEENRKKPVLGKLGTLFTAGRKRSTSSDTKSVSPKDGTTSKLPEREGGKSPCQGSQPKPTADASPEGCALEAAGERSEGCGAVAAAGRPGHESESPQLEPPQARGETFPDATAAAKQPHSSPGNSSGLESSETPAHSPGEHAAPGAGGEPELAPGARGVPGSPTRERPAGGLGEVLHGAPGACAEGVSPGSPGARRQSREDASAPPGDPIAEGAGNRGGPGQEGSAARPGERAHPAKVLTLDIYLSKTEVAQVDEQDVLAPEAEDGSDCDDMEKRSGGRRSGRRRRSQKSTDSPGADVAMPESAGRDDAVFDDEVAPNAAAESQSAEKKVKSPRAAPDGGVASAGSPESKASPSPKGQLRGEPDRSKQPLPASSPTKRKGRSRAPESVPTAPGSVLRAVAKESVPKKSPTLDPSPAAKGAAAEDAEEAARVIPRELTVKSSSLLPEIKPEHKRGPLPNHLDGRSRESAGRQAGAADAEGLKARSHLGAGRSTVTTKVTLPARPKHVELNLKTPKNSDGLGNEHNPFSHPVHKGNTATKISLFENKRASNSSPRHTEARAPRNIPASSKTFVGRAKLNLAKKAKEMEHLEKKGAPTSSQNGVPEKEMPTESLVSVPGEEKVPAEPRLGGKTVSHPSEPPAPPSAKDQGPPSEEAPQAADSQKAELDRTCGAAQDRPAVLDTKDLPSTTTQGPQDEASASQPPAESSHGPFLPRPGDTPGDTCSQVPLTNSLHTELEVTESRDGGTVPVSHHNGDKVPTPELGGGKANPPVSPEPEGKGGPSRVLVRSFVLPVDSARDVSSHLLSGSSEVQEVQLPSCHNNELEVVSVTSCNPQQEEIPDNESPSPTQTPCRGEHVAESDPQVSLPNSEMAVPTVQAQSQGERTPARVEASSAPRPGGEAMNGQDSPARLLNVSADSDDSVFDSSSDMEKFTEIIKNLDSTVCLPQKKKKGRPPHSPAPRFAMPPIHEDNLEKVFDPSVFTFGLGKKKESQAEMSPALHLMQNLDAKSKLRPKRASTEQSVLFKSLHATANGTRESGSGSDVTDREAKEVPNGGGIKRSRLEKSALFSSILSSLPQDKVFSPSVTSVNSMTTTFSTTQNGPSSQSAGPQPATEGAPPQGSLQEPPSPNTSLQVFSFNSNPSQAGLKSSNTLEKHLPKEETKEDLTSRGTLHLPEARLSELSKLKNREDTERTNHAESVLKLNVGSYSGGGDTDFMELFKSGRYDPSTALSGMSLSDSMALRGGVQNKLNPRPGKVVIYSEPDISDKCLEVFSDVLDCSSWSLSPVILIKVVRGCWILYEKPNFEGNSIPLEEGELELSGLWGVEDILERNEEEESASKPVVIGSIRHVVQDYRISQIDLFTEPEGLGILSSYFDDTEEMQGFGVMHKTCSIKVHWGTWLIYEEPGFQGVPFVLEPGEYPDLSFWDTEEAYIGSMRPLKMGGRKVEFPTDPKVIIYEKPFFEGKCVELETEMCSILTEEGETGETTGDDCLPLASVGSMKVLRGIWVAYEKPGFTGHQYLLEEGEYKDWNDWGGYNGELQSLRPILGDFSNAHMIMYSEKNFGSKGSSIDVLGIVANLKETGYGVKTQSINVLSGVWVAYENPDFTGEQYVLDKGFYTTFEDWGGRNCKISSVQPISLDSFNGPRRRNQIHLFSEPQFQGHSQTFEETTSQIDDSFSTKSCRVLGGSWVAYDGENFSGNQYVLEEGHYPCLSAMGCLPGATFKSLRFIDVEFSEPTIILFERENFKGKKIELNAETVNLRSLGFSTQICSVQVIGGIWVTYEFGNYRGRQFLLSPAEVCNWYEFSGCRQIGSLRPFIQKRIYFRLRNKATGLFMSTNGNLEDLKLLRVQVMEDVGADDQIWVYQEGCIKCRIAEDCCLTIVGSLVTSGSKLGLALDQNAESQFWCMKSDGRIYSKLKPNLVLDIKGGAQYDQNHIILNTMSKEKLTQVWEAMVL